MQYDNNDDTFFLDDDGEELSYLDMLNSRFECTAHFEFIMLVFNAVEPFHVREFVFLGETNPFGSTLLYM